MIFVKQKPKFLERPIRKERVPREPIKTKKKQANCVKRGKMRVTQSSLVLILHLIG